MNSTERHEARYQRRKAARIEKKAKALKEFGDFGAVFSFDHLYASYRASIKGVGWKASTQRYKSSALAHIAKTQEELLTGKYRSRGFYDSAAYAITASSLHYQSRLSTTMAQACPEKAMTSPYPA